VTNFGIKDYDENIGVPGASISVIDIQNICEVKRLFTYKDLAEYKKYKVLHMVLKFHQMEIICMSTLKVKMKKCLFII
jgi:hypothetical protein